MDWRIKQTAETDEFNENYGNLDTEQYYEEDIQMIIANKLYCIHLDEYMYIVYNKQQHQ